jgi:hypothetical protein
MTRARIVALALATLLAVPAIARAQTPVEITPFGGYRFGGDFFELITGEPVDLDGAPAFGVAVDVPIRDPHGYQIEGLFSHEQADLTVHRQPFGPATIAHVTVDHWMGGGLQEFGDARVRPFLTGMLGLTRYAGEGDSEIRFALSAGGGVKLFPTKHVGLRLDGRLFATFVEADLGFLACNSFNGTCVIAFRTDVVFQAEFTAGAVLKF